MTQAMVPFNPSSLEETMTLGKVLAQSGFFSDSREAAQAVVKVLAGAELGFGPVASMTGVNIIKGKVALSANLIAAAIKRSGRYNYRVRELTDQVCVVEFFEQGQSVGVSSFSMVDAKNAGLATGDNWRKFPRNMLFARAISNGAKWYCPDLSGGPLYTPEELGAQVDGETGEVINAPAPRIVIEQTTTQPTVTGNGATAKPNGATQPAQVQATNGTQTEDKPSFKTTPRPWGIDNTVNALQYTAATTKNELPANGQWGALIGLLDSEPFDTLSRRTLLKVVFGVDSSKDLNGQQRYALHAWAKPAKIGDTWAMDSHAIAEYAAIVNVNRISDDDLDDDDTDFDPVTAGDFIEGPGF